MPGVPLLANMTEFGKTPFFTAAEFEAMGYAMVIWPVSSLRVANKAQAGTLRRDPRDGGTHKMVDAMQTRAELYDTIGCMITRRSIVPSSEPSFPTAMPQN